MAERCTATKANGDPCQAWRANGHELCAGHAGLGKLDAKAAGAKSAEVRSRKAAQRRKSYLDILAEELENDALQNVEAYRKARNDGDWRAVDAWTTRVHGKPIERVQTTSDALNPAQMTAAERAELRRRLVVEHPELLELVPRRVTSAPEHELQVVDTAETA